MPGHWLRFASTPVSAQVMTHRSGSRLIFSAMVVSLAVPFDELPHAACELGQNAAQIGGIASSELAQYLTENLHRLDRNLRGKLLPLVGKLDVDHAAVLLRTPAHDELLPLHAIDD